MPSRTLVRCLLLLLGVLLVQNCIAGENVLLISVDTLRADRLSCYGYLGNQTSHIDKWAREGVLFERAYSEVPLTLPTHATMLTGRFPFSHGVRENVGYTVRSDLVTLAEHFKAAGYSTAAFIGSYVLGSEFGVAQGFDHYDEEFKLSIESVNATTELQRPADDVTDRFLGWLGLNGKKPFFVFVHFYDPHTPRPNGYDWEVTQVDRNIGRIDSFLRSEKLADNTVIILTSDHGESLGEHGEQGHGFFIYDATLHVPLIIRHPNGPKSKVFRQQVSLVDLAPTILDLTALKVPGEIEGRSLVPLFKGHSISEGPIYSESFIPYLHFGWSSLRSLRVEDYKCIEAPRPELYKLSSDPRELRNVYESEPEEFEECQEKLRSFLKDHNAQEFERPVDSIDPQARRKLAALGYISLSSGMFASDSRAKIDPKDRIQFFERYHTILNEITSGMVNEGVLEQIDAIEMMAPEARGVHLLRAWSYEEMGRRAEAAVNYAKAVNEDPENPVARARYGRILIEQQKYAEAEIQIDEALKLAPKDYKTRNNLAGLYYMTGRPDQALSELIRITEARPSYAVAWQNLGQLYLQRREWSNAESALRHVLEVTPNNGRARYLLSSSLRAQGRDEEADAEMDAAIRLDPQLKPKR